MKANDVIGVYWDAELDGGELNAEALILPSFVIYLLSFPGDNPR
jgi:hypothetical protein